MRMLAGVLLLMTSPSPLEDAAYRNKSLSRYHKNSFTRFASRSRHAFVGHSYDRARVRVYHSLLLLGAHLGHWRRRLNSIFAAKLLTKDEARRIAANIAKLLELLGR
jgi:hypothetical protein